jgi:hypothetical protein
MTFRDGASIQMNESDQVVVEPAPQRDAALFSSAIESAPA